MLKKLRERKKIKMIMFLIAILIIPAFVLWGVGSALRQRQRTSLAGKVFSRKISKEEFLKQYKAIYSQALLTYGDYFDKLKDYLNLEGQTWQRIILLQEARRRRIQVKDSEIVEWVKSNPLFQKEGKFDKNTYQTILKYYANLNPREYEEYLRETLKIRKLLEEVTEGIDVTEEEAWKRYKQGNDLYRISYILFKSSDYSDKVSFTPQELVDFYQENKQAFKKPDQVNLLYLKLDPVNYLEEVEVSEEEIEEYFQKHKEEFKEEKEAEGQSSEENQDKPLRLSDQIKKEIEFKLKREKARLKAEDLAWEISSQLSQGISLEAVASQHKLEVKETGFFSPWDPIPGIGWAYKLTQKAFNLKPGETSDLIEIGEGFYFIKVKEKKPPYIPQFEEVKEEVEEAFKRKRAEELAFKDAQEKLSQMLNLKPEELEEFLAQNNLSLRETDYLNRDKYVAGVGKASNILDNLKVQNPNQLNPEVISVPSGVLIVRLDELKPTSREEFEKVKSSYKEKILAQKKEEALNEWFQQLSQRANLEVYYRIPK